MNEDRLTELERIFDNFRIAIHGDVGGGAGEATGIPGGSTPPVTPTVICDSTPHTLSKCGFSGCGGSNRFFFTRTIDRSWHTDSNVGGPDCMYGTDQEIQQYSFTDNVCSEFSDRISCTGTGHDCLFTPQDCTGCLFVGGDCYGYDAPETTACSDCVHTSGCTDETVEYINDDCTGANEACYVHQTTTYSDEYTTAMLIDNTIALLSCGAGCTPTYILSDDESSCTAWCVPA